MQANFTPIGGNPVGPPGYPPHAQMPPGGGFPPGPPMMRPPQMGYMQPPPQQMAGGYPGPQVQMPRPMGGAPHRMPLMQQVSLVCCRGDLLDNTKWSAYYPNPYPRNNDEV